MQTESPIVEAPVMLEAPVMPEAPVMLEDSAIIDSIPNASEIIQSNLESPEERMIKELMRNGYIMKCRDFVYRYIRTGAGAKIIYRNGQQKNNAHIFRYSPPAARGVITQFYSQVVYDTTNSTFSFDYQRPNNHSKDIWYFPVWYVMNGMTKNVKRQFSTIGMETVESMLRTLFEGKQYGIKFYRNRVLDNGQQTGNLVVVSWAPAVQSEDQNMAEPQDTGAENQQNVSDQTTPNQQ
jgi:hypothetical protein